MGWDRLLGCQGGHPSGVEGGTKVVCVVYMWEWMGMHA